MLLFRMTCQVILAAMTATSLLADEKSLEWVYLQNQDVKVGLLKSHGGALGFLAVAGTEKNLLNHYDHGRLVQQSYYGDADNSRWGDKAWRYNPVQGGGYQGQASEIVELQSTETSAKVVTIPRHWATGELLRECRMEQQVTLQGPLVHLQFRFTYAGKAVHAPRHQEIPAMFVNPQYRNLVTYSGDQPGTMAPVTSRIPGWPNEEVKLSEHWGAYVDDSQHGIGIYVPLAQTATCYRYQGGNGSDCSYIAPLTTFALTPHLEFQYDAWLTTGSVQTIRERFLKLPQEQL